MCRNKSGKIDTKADKQTRSPLFNLASSYSRQEEFLIVRQKLNTPFQASLDSIYSKVLGRKTNLLLASSPKPPVFSFPRET